MKNLIILLALLCGLTAHAQYRYRGPYTLASSTTNALILANTNITYNSSAELGAGNYIQVQLGFTVVTNADGGTNNVVATFQKSLDDVRYDSQFTLTLPATTNTEAYLRTNLSWSSDVYLKLVSVTNGNAFALTNFFIKVGQKTGL